MYPTLAALAGTAEPTDDLDGSSLAALFDDPTLTTLPNGKGTRNKTVAYSQYPHTSNFGCPFYRDNRCYNDTSPTAKGFAPTADHDKTG